jgi:hypothetical protein
MIEVLRKGLSSQFSIFNAMSRFDLCLLLPPPKPALWMKCPLRRGRSRLTRGRSPRSPRASLARDDRETSEKIRSRQIADLIAAQLRSAGQPRAPPPQHARTGRAGDAGGCPHAKFRAPTTCTDVRRTQTARGRGRPCHTGYCSLSYSAWACLRTGMSGSASFQAAKKS